ncbi:right-handed parallel beta-helix repeat-containing protein [Shewanella submarina]|uniref:Right-handed parallel beta-helix repeat-containing protein n=1 Tax=Shewanella submarina TaxID=2016376 RepID=A0ABV7G8C5_9GAMM|nr:right-handed parallel beta-helix repeat-containing protein [Shewanella submarina]MCL1038430.1 right-handed parallel beta-helix repeat-containing protein [Shewanella submarina]
MKKTTVILALLSLPLANTAMACSQPNACSAGSSSSYCKITLANWGVTTGNTDNSTCMKNAVNFAINQSGSKNVDLVFGSGTYKFKDPVSVSVKSKHSNTNFTFANSRIAVAGKTSNKQMTIRGQGIGSTTLQFVGFNDGTSSGLNGLSLYSSNKVAINNMSLTYDKYPFTQGKFERNSISSKSDDTVIIALDSGYDAPQQFIRDNTDKSYIVTFKGDVTYEKVPSDLKFTASRHLGGNRYELSGLDKTTRSYLYDYHRVDSNLKVALSPKVGGESLYFFNSSNVSAQNIEISNAPAVAVRGQNGGSNISLNNVNYKRKRIGNSVAPLMAGTAGGYIFQSIRGGLKIRNSTIDHNADDSLGLFARGTDLLRVSGNTVDVNEKKAQFISTGDVVDLYDAANSKKNDKSLTVNAIQSLGNGNIRLTFNKNVNNSVVGDYIGSRNATIGTSGNRFLIENNTLQHNKGRGIRSNASYGDIRNNTIRRNGNGGIWMGGDAEHNSQCSLNVTITGNNAVQQLHGPAILVYNAIKHDPSTLKCNKNLTITGNTISEQANSTPAIFIDNTNNATVSNNNFQSEFGSASAVKKVLYERLRTSGITASQRNNTVVLSNYAKGLTVSGNSTASGKGTSYSKTSNTR